MVELDLAAIDIFPAGIEQTSVGQRPGRVVVLGVGRDQPDVVAVTVAAVNDAHLGFPAVDPALAAGGNKGQAAVRQSTSVHNRRSPRSQLLQARAVGFHLVKVEKLGAGWAIGEEDFSSLVMHLRIADGTTASVEQHGQLACSDVPLGRGPAARDFGWGRGGEAGASPQRAVRAEPTKAPAKEPPPCGFSRKRLSGFVVPRSQTTGGYARSSRLARKPFPRKQDPAEF